MHFFHIKNTNEYEQEFIKISFLPYTPVTPIPGNALLVTAKERSDEFFLPKAHVSCLLPACPDLSKDKCLNITHTLPYLTVKSH